MTQVLTRSAWNSSIQRDGCSRSVSIKDRCQSAAFESKLPPPPGVRNQVRCDNKHHPILSLPQLRTFVILEQ
ncbi:MAG: hypothetical protein ACT4TC_08750 [Myxococcaceae bacterium]